MLSVSNFQGKVKAKNEAWEDECNCHQQETCQEPLEDDHYEILTLPTDEIAHQHLSEQAASMVV
jgi:hypothetical protein